MQVRRLGVRRIGADQLIFLNKMRGGGAGERPWRRAGACTPINNLEMVAYLYLCYFFSYWHFS